MMGFKTFLIMERLTAIMVFKILTISSIFILAIITVSCFSATEKEDDLKECISALTSVILSHNHDVTALTPRSIKTLPPRNYHPMFPDPMTEGDEYWNPGAKRTFKIIEENCPSDYYDQKVLDESKSFIDYGY
jgi:hypothetical protein